MQLQLWKSDEYGQGSIEATSTNVSELIKKAKSEVNTANVSNALAVSEKENNWEALYIELYDTDTEEIVEDAVYGGKTTTGHHCVVKTDDTGEIYKLDDCDVQIRIYLGNIDRKDWYLKDARGLDYVTDINRVDMTGKSIYYIRPVRQPKVK